MDLTKISIFLFIQCLKKDKEIDVFYKRQPIMRQTQVPLRSPLLPLSYEQVR